MSAFETVMALVFAVWLSFVAGACYATSRSSTKLRFERDEWARERALLRLRLGKYEDSP